MKKSDLKNNLNVVILEDDISFMEILNLKISNLGFKTYPFNNVKQAVDFIKNNNLIFLITDYSLSSNNAKKIITDLRNQNLDFPFIVVTGEGNEEIASDIMKLGALDYIIKDTNFLKEISNKFLNAIDKYNYILEKQEWQKKIEISEQKYHKIFDNIIDIYFEINNNRIITELSPSVKNILGYERDELIGKKFNIFTDNINTKIILNKLKKSKYLNNYRTTIKTKNKHIKTIEVNIKKNK